MWNGVAEHTVDLITVEVRDEPVWVTTELGELREGVSGAFALQVTDATA